jgi:hypothetical protein
MSESQPEDDQTAICHMCGQTFTTQEDLSKHLMDVHPDDGLADSSDEP